MPKAKTKETKEIITEITPEDYKRILMGLEIIRIDVDDFSGKVVDRAELFAKAEKRTVNLTETTRFETGEVGEVVIWHCYNIVVLQDDTEASPQLFTLSVEFRVQYESELPFTVPFFEKFREMSLHLQTAPFARAWIHDHCLRMGVPPLILPLIRTP